VAGLSFPTSILGAEAPAPVSELTEECLMCHVTATPGIVADWKRSRHYRTTPAQALKTPELKRRVSIKEAPEKNDNVVVGCAECHMMNPEAHSETFEHNGRKVHTLVTPDDCMTCHPTEREQFSKNLMAHARGNLTKNKLYHSLKKAINGTQKLQGKKLATKLSAANDETENDSCFHCHGTEVKVIGKEERDTEYGVLEFPKYSGWPNQGVGRVNTDGSMGSCSACHSRHEFSIEMARKPYTCSQCHKGPDVPAYKAYNVSKHGNLFSAMNSHWRFREVPWTIGKDFTGPTCAVCHVSLLTTEEGDVVAQRTHQMNNRLPWRILGLIYAHPHTKSPDTSIVKNAQGLQLPTSLDGSLAKEYLISEKEMDERKETLQKICLSCHSSNWVEGHWARLENTIEVTNEMTKTATQLTTRAWEKGLADQANLFDEGIEKQWVEQWLFYANSVRFATAMMGADYGVFANGRWYLSKNLQEMIDRIKSLDMAGKGQEPKSDE
jgi:hypothetical protein